jgi:hypothetical protein
VVNVSVGERRPNIVHSVAAKELGIRHLQLLLHIVKDSWQYSKKQYPLDHAYSPRYRRELTQPGSRTKPRSASGSLTASKWMPWAAVGALDQPRPAPGARLAASIAVTAGRCCDQRRSAIVQQDIGMGIRENDLFEMGRRSTIGVHEPEARDE